MAEAELSDDELIDRILGGEQRLFEVVMRRNNQRLFRTARSILRDDTEAEDAVQQAYLSAYRALPTFRRASSLSTWLTRITMNESLQRLKKRRAIQNTELDMTQEEPAPTPEEHTALQELGQVLTHAIDALPASYRTVFVLREVQELSTREVGECLDLTEEAVRVRLHRARSQLRERLGSTGGTGIQSVFGFAGDRCDRIVAKVLASLAEEPGVNVHGQASAAATPVGS